MSVPAIFEHTDRAAARTPLAVSTKNAMQSVRDHDDEEMRLAGTPAKASHRRSFTDGHGDGHGLTKARAEDKSAALLSSPAILSFARKITPPALSAKPRKSTSLFGNSPSSDARKKKRDEDADSRHDHGGPRSGVSLTPRNDSDGSLFSDTSRPSAHGKGTICEPAVQDGAAELPWGTEGGSGVTGMDCFTSPTRAPREASRGGDGGGEEGELFAGYNHQRVTPQRNLGGLFASPVAARRGLGCDGAPVTPKTIKNMFTAMGGARQDRSDDDEASGLTGSATGDSGGGGVCGGIVVLDPQLEPLQSPERKQSGEQMTKPSDIGSDHPALVL